MMLRFGTVSSLQHLQKNPGQAARGVCCVWKNDFQMAVIRFQGEGRRRSRDVSVNSSQQLQSKVWGKRRPAQWFVFPFDWFLYFLILRVLTLSSVPALGSDFLFILQTSLFSLSTSYSIHACHLTPQSLHSYAHKYCEISYRVCTTCWVPTSQLTCVAHHR